MTSQGALLLILGLGVLIFNVGVGPAFSRGAQQVVKKVAQLSTGEQVSRRLELAEVYRQQGQWQLAQQLVADGLQQLAQVADSSQYWQLRGQAWELQGKLQLATGKAEEALQSWQLAKGKYTQARDDQGAVRTQVYQALALQELGLHQKAIAILTPTLSYWQQEEVETQALSLRLLANILLVTGEVKNAQLQEFIVQFRGAEISNWDYLQQVRGLLEESLAISSPSSVSYQESLLSLGNAARAAYQRFQSNFERLSLPGCIS
ncbi:MAG: hypothetical protein F6K24_46075 [Okeania sp. SIO2D1]|nr:hypothetical protein [Okeania sp. SIO2D1]